MSDNDILGAGRQTTMGDNGRHSPRLSAKQRRFVAFLATTPTIRDAAKAADVGETTAWRWLRQPAIKAEIRARQDAMLAQVSAGIVADMSAARQALVAVLDDKGASAPAKVNAAGRLLDCGLRLFELGTLSDRVAEIERRLEVADETREQDRKARG